MASSIAGGHFFLLALLLLSSAAYGELSPNFYTKSCPSLDTIISKQVNHTLFNDPPPQGGRRMGASLLRLFFHDCFVQGCDASVLLDNDFDLFKGIILSEKDAGPNGSLRGFELIDQIKVEVEKACPSVVSCADILALATRAAVVALNGPTWPLRLGRRDSTTANQMAAKSDLPSPDSDLDTLITAFETKGFNVGELVALSGAHTIGLANCKFADSNQTQARCPNADANTTVSLDLQTPEKFDNLYYDNLKANRGLLHSDRVLTSRSNVTVLVDKYKSNQGLFFDDFKRAMTKMSELRVLTGTNNGQVRTNCRKLN